ncbi:MAG TPA: hypothetical protein VMW16_12240 [Sedimentisphaerales bacterium]|nr:hypothetical protein [Sedimentisphaerales bacterium]
MEDFEEFIKLCQDRFSFLREEYGFGVDKVRQDKWQKSWAPEFRMKNDTTAVRLIFERREYRVFVYLCQLVAGQYVPDPIIIITADAVLREYEFDNLLLIRAPQLIWPEHGPETKLDRELLGKMLAHKAQSVREYAADVLQGDFAIFPQLEKMVKRRAQELAEEA